MGAINAISPYLLCLTGAVKSGREAQDTGQSVATQWSAPPNQCTSLTVWAQTEFHIHMYEHIVTIDALSP